MPIDQLIPPVFPSWDRDIGFPAHTTVIDLGVNLAAGDFESGYDNAMGSGTRLTDFMQLVTGYVHGFWVRNQGVPGVALNAGAFPSGYWWGDPLLITGPFNDDAGGAFPCAVNPLEVYRAYIDTVYVSFETPITLSSRSKPIIYVPTESTIEPAIDGIANDQYGIRCDGAGGFEFFSAIAGVETESTAITWPAGALGDWVRVDVEHQVATPAGAGQVRFFLNGNVVITRSFSLATMPDLTDGTTPTDSAFMRRMSVCDDDGPDTDIYLAMFRCRAGRFTIEGTELT